MLKPTRSDDDEQPTLTRRYVSPAVRGIPGYRHAGSRRSVDDVVAYGDPVSADEDVKMFLFIAVQVSRYGTTGLMHCFDDGISSVRISAIDADRLHFTFSALPPLGLGIHVSSRHVFVVNRTKLSPDTASVDRPPSRGARPED
ncbi:hypothetical protein AWC13_15690 [Mycobacterium kubicae]|nr:hypothetical protein AWC13_15690 [Mycobacterium kubicae]